MPRGNRPRRTVLLIKAEPPLVPVCGGIVHAHSDVRLPACTLVSSSQKVFDFSKTHPYGPHTLTYEALIGVRRAKVLCDSWWKSNPRNCRYAWVATWEAQWVTAASKLQGQKSLCLRD